MKKILLVCAAGMSTSILVQKMLSAAAERGIDCQIEAHGNVDIASQKGLWDVCLIGPQIRFSQNEIANALEGMPVEVIDMMVYSSANGEKALARALELIDEN